MVLGYEFLNLDEEARHARRLQLDFWATVAEWSAVVVFAGFQIAFFVSFLLKFGLDYEEPKSPSFHKRQGKLSWLRKFRIFSEKSRWWLRKPVISDWGTRGEWIFGGLWTFWLLYLSFVQTGKDYLHLTKRFGIVGASQLPLHYLLAMRSPSSPVQFLTRLAHEELKAAHQVLGRIIFLFFVLHAAFYLNFFIVGGYLSKRIRDKDVIFGLLSILLFTILSTTALSLIRRRNYRLFYISHVTIANLVIVSLWLHVHHIRFYIYQVMLIYSIHMVLRSLSLNIFSGTVKLIPRTNLIQIRIPLIGNEPVFTWKPGQHVYLSRPTGTAYNLSLSQQLALRSQTNPFTVASIPRQDKELLLVARTLGGNTKHLSELAKSLSATGSEDVANIPIALEGPYGASVRLPDFNGFDRILLVAGGVGATFVLPVYRSIIDNRDPDQNVHTPIRFVWAVKKLAETSWAKLPKSQKSVREGEEDEVLQDKDAVEVYVTRPEGPPTSFQTGGEDEGDDIELAEDEQLLSMEEQMEKPREGMVVKTGRPKVSAIVDEVCGNAYKVAVVACGPKNLTEELSWSVEQWIGKGVDIYWHNETFGW